MNISRAFVVIFSIALFAACESNQKKLAQQALNPTPESPHAGANVHMVTAEEVLQTEPYSYVKVNEEGKKYWIAITRREIEIGNTYYFKPEGLMIDFESKQLNRTFDSIYFVSKFGAHGMASVEDAHGQDPDARMSTEKQNNLSVEPVEGGITIADLYGDKDAFDAKTVLVRGIVVKVNEGILNKNWVHIQDGTKSGDHFDLTITTDDLPRVDEVVTYEGKISLNKDFGAGYKYDIIMEDAVNIDRKKSI